MIISYIAMILAILGIVIFFKSVIDDSNKEILKLSLITEQQKEEIEALRSTIQFGLDMRAAWIAKLAKMQPMEALSELQNEAERNNRTSSNED